MPSGEHPLTDTRLGVYVDARYAWTADGGVQSDIPFLRVVAEAAAAFTGLTVMGRVRRSPDGAGFALPSETEVVALPDYAKVSPTAILRAAPGTLRAMWRGLDHVDAVWVFGPHPFGVLVAVLAAARRRRVALGIRQDTPAYFGERASGASGRVGLAGVRALDAAFRWVSRRIPTVVVGHALAARYGSARRPAIVTTFCQMQRGDMDDYEDADLDAGRLLTVGRIEPEKNPELVVEIMAELERRRPGAFRLRWVGGGSRETAVRALTRERGLTDVIDFAGYLPFGPELIAEYRRASMFLHVSLTEGVPQVLFEAMGCGTPVVATDVGGVRSALDDGSLGLLVPPDDRDAAVDAVLRLADDADLRRSLSGRSRRRARQAALDVEGSRLGGALADALRRPAMARRAKAMGLADRVGVPRAMEAVLPNDRLTVLAYHRIVDPDRVYPFDPGVVSAAPADFARQMEWVADRFTVLSIEEICAVVARKRRPPRRPLLLTFDDGYADNHANALPVLRRLGLPAVVFVATGAIDTRAVHWWDAVASVLQRIPAGVLSVPLLGERLVVGYDSRVKLRHELCRALKTVGAPERWDAIKRLEETAGQSIAHDPDLMMSWPQLRELLDAGVDVQPHTVTHPILTQVSADQVRDEISGSMSRIHEELGRPAVGLAYPNGSYDARVLEVTRSLGIHLAFTMEPGPVSLGRVRKHPLQVARVSVESSDDLSSFRLQTMGASAALARVRRLRSL